MRAPLALPVVLSLAAACALLPRPDPDAEIASALDDLREGGFKFDPDVRFREHRYTVCNGMACADLVLIGERRTILLAPESFESPSRLRATLVEVWGRYQEPRTPRVRDLAEGSLRIQRDGPRAGVDDPVVLRDAYFSYRQLWQDLPPDERRDLPPPDTLAYP